jgi:hypothetical protein
MNRGNSSLVLVRAETSTAHINVYLQNEVVEPKDEGHLRIVLDPASISGPFQETIALHFNNGDYYNLRLKGIVLAEDEWHERGLVFSNEKFRLAERMISLGEIYNIEKLTYFLRVFNESSDPLHLSFPDLPEYVEIETTPEVIESHRDGMLEILYDAQRQNDWWYTFENIDFIVNDGPKRHRFTLTATISEDFSHIPEEELETAPHIEFAETVFDFGTIRQEDKAEHVFVFTNTGKSDLVLRKVRSSCGCTVVTPKKTLVPPGETGVIKAVFNSGQREGKQTKMIAVIANDPLNPVTYLKITGMVEGG